MLGLVAMESAFHQKRLDEGLSLGIIVSQKKKKKKKWELGCLRITSPKLHKSGSFGHWVQSLRSILIGRWIYL